MITPLLHLLRLSPSLCGGHRLLALENLALRQQLAVYKRTANRPKLQRSDRLLWVGLSCRLAVKWLSRNGWPSRYGCQAATAARYFATLQAPTAAEALRKAVAEGTIERVGLTPAGDWLFRGTKAAARTAADGCGQSGGKAS